MTKTRTHSTSTTYPTQKPFNIESNSREVSTPSIGNTVTQRCVGRTLALRGRPGHPLLSWFQSKRVWGGRGGVLSGLSEMGIAEVGGNRNVPTSIFDSCAMDATVGIETLEKNWIVATTCQLARDLSWTHCSGSGGSGVAGRIVRWKYNRCPNERNGNVPFVWTTAIEKHVAQKYLHKNPSQLHSAMVQEGLMCRGGELYTGRTSGVMIRCVALSVLCSAANFHNMILTNDGGRDGVGFVDQRAQPTQCPRECLHAVA